MKDVLRFIVMDSGGQYAVMGLTQIMPMLFASNWDMMHHLVLMIFHCMLKMGMELVILHFVGTCMRILAIQQYGVALFLIYQVMYAFQ